MILNTGLQGNKKRPIICRYIKQALHSLHRRKFKKKIPTPRFFIMENIKIQYYYNGEPYNLTSEVFPTEWIDNDLSNFIKPRYIKFADKINKQNGYLKVDLSFCETKLKSIDFLITPLGITEDLHNEIADYIGTLSTTTLPS
jgi:hypothetical protein